MMDSTFGTITVGTSVTETKESILAEELALLQDKKMTLKDENNNYLASHPEFGILIDDFVAAIFKQKPDDIIKFGEKYFGDLYEKDHPRPKKSEYSDKVEIPLPLVIVGPSGVGKGTLVNRLITHFSEMFGFSVSHTTRQPRPGEVHGVQYFFVDEDSMKQNIDAGMFIEHAFVHTNYYGTSFEAVESIKNAGKICILDIDVQGVQNVKKINFQCKYLFIAPPSIEVLEERLRARSTESEEKLSIRLDNARGEIEYGLADGNFDGVVINDNLDKAYNDMLSLLMQWYPGRTFDTLIKDKNNDDNDDLGSSGNNTKELEDEDDEYNDNDDN